jgi:hydrogenase maturation protease
VKILVLGMGNDLFGDDGVGLHAVRLLQDEWADGDASGEPSSSVEFVECVLSGAALLDVIHGYDALVVIDTIMKAEPVTGRIRVLNAADIRDFPGPSPHYVSVPQVLAIGRELGLKMPRTVTVIAVEATDLFRLGEGLSEEMQTRLPDILEAAKDVLHRLAAQPDERVDRLRRIRCSVPITRRPTTWPPV